MLKAIVKAPIRLYRLLISPVLPSSCRFTPTCSAYALEAIERHGAFKGIALSLRRITKCHPFSKYHGHDPVPPDS